MATVALATSRFGFKKQLTSSLSPSQVFSRIRTVPNWSRDEGTLMAMMMMVFLLGGYFDVLSPPPLPPLPPLPPHATI